MIICKDILVRNETLTLTTERAIFWKRGNALILSDLHIGKTAHFRKHGIPIPDDILKKDLERLDALLMKFKPEKMIVVGDLFHAEANVDLKSFKRWLLKHQNLEIILVKGNHDRLPGFLMNDFSIKVVNELESPPFTFLHDPSHKKDETVKISGHLHPGVLIKGKGKQKIKLPSYVVTNELIILPAFSLFTGLNTRLNFTENEYFAFSDAHFY